MRATTTAAPDAPQQARSQRRFLCGGGGILLPLCDGLDGPISSMPSSSELCTGLYCTMGTATLRRSTAVASSGFQATSEGYGCPKAHAPEDWVISRPQGDTTSTLPAVLPTHASLAAAGCLADALARALCPGPLSCPWPPRPPQKALVLLLVPSERLPATERRLPRPLGRPVRTARRLRPSRIPLPPPTAKRERSPRPLCHPPNAQVFRDCLR